MCVYIKYSIYLYNAHKRPDCKIDWKIELTRKIVCVCAERRPKQTSAKRHKEQNTSSTLLDLCWQFRGIWVKHLISHVMALVHQKLLEIS